MAGKTRRPLTVDQIVQIYQLTKDGYTPNHVARESGVSYPTVTGTFRHIERYLLGDYPKKFANHTYLRAARKIKKVEMQTVTERNTVSSNPFIAVQETLPNLESDRYERIEQAFQTFQDRVADFIKEEVDARTEAVRVELGTAQAKLRRLEPVVEKAKNSNFVTNLKNRWL